MSSAEFEALHAAALDAAARAIAAPYGPALLAFIEAAKARAAALSPSQSRSSRGLPCDLELPDDQAQALRDLIDCGACFEATNGALDRVTVGWTHLTTEGMLAVATLREHGIVVVEL